MRPARIDASRQQRLGNATDVLRQVWSTESFTGSDVIAATGLTRSTVLGLCADLLARGWIQELDDTRRAGQYSKGRPARRYGFDSHAGHVVGVDAGQHRITASVADLDGSILASAVEIDPGGEISPAKRRRMVLGAIRAALEQRGEHPGPVLALVIGVPAPVDAEGVSPDGHEGYWSRMNPGLAQAASSLAQRVVVDNDANLAAVAEGAVGAGRDLRSFAALLSGERFGAGLIVDGALLRGRLGGAGELRLLELVEGVKGSHGLGHLARDLIRQAIEDGEVPCDSELPQSVATGEEHPDAIAVFAAARAGDEVAIGIVDELAERLARVCAVIATMLDLERIVVSGAIAPALDHLVHEATRRLTEHVHPPVPTIVASSLGGDVVRAGALHRALAIVQEDPLAFTVGRQATHSTA
ncbi:ROK family protein [Pseudactinotalea sp. Z1739]|uniref:ROK family protein n=1 Tax=Pseudactinotalea sp. Z1739 TaxID=3413028 RepID=UPI003C7A55F5